MKKENKKKNKKKTLFMQGLTKYWIILVLILALGLYLWLNHLDPVLLWDETVYLGNAREVISKSYFTEDFRPPLLEYIIAGAWLITGESIFTARLTIMLFSLGSIFVFYLISKKLFKNALLPTLFFAFSSEFIYWSFRAYADVVSVFFILLSLYLFTKERKNNKEKNWLYVLAGLFASLSFLARFPFALFAAAIGIYCLIKKKWKPLVFFGMGCFIGLLPWMIYNLVVYNNPLWDFFALYSAVSEYTSFQSPLWLLLYLLENLFVMVLFIPLGIYGIYLAAKKRKKVEFNFWIIISIYLVISLIYHLFFVKQKLMRYNLALIPFFILICYLGLVEFYKLIKAKKTTKIIIALALIFLMLIPSIIHIDTIKAEGECKEILKQATEYVKKNTSPGQTLLGNEWIIYGYYANLNAFSLWDTDIDMLVDFYKPAYVVHHSQKGIPYSVSILEESSKLTLDKTLRGECFDIKIFKTLQ